MNEKHNCSDFDDFLQTAGVLAETEAIAIKRVIAFQVTQLILSKIYRRQRCRAE